MELGLKMSSLILVGNEGEMVRIVICIPITLAIYLGECYFDK